MTLGPTHWDWDGDVAAIARTIRARWPSVRCNTYRGHPWPGWDARSIDVWGAGGRGSPLALQTGYEIRKWLMGLPGRPWIRHTIYEHQLWTSFGGYSHWAAHDHTGLLRHLHVTYHKPLD